jgi:cellulose synthase/poly-beta-1,6-N-acetylglucosamine synthase-like glycosyltransferase
VSNRLRISLVIPAYNEESHLGDCLSAALEQTLPFYEIIVVDNNSSDATAALAESFPNIRVVHEQRQGIVHARDRGFNAASGDIIARIDADTVLPEHWAEYITEFYRDKANLGIAWTGGGWFYDVPFSRLVSATYSAFAFSLNTLLIGTPTMWGSNMALPRTLWQQIRHTTCTEHGIHEDLDMAIHLRAAGASICYDSQLQVPAQLRKAYASRAELWDYLQWWPRTLQNHGYASWRLCWMLSVLPLYMATPFLKFAHVLRRRKAQPLSAFEV